MTHDPKQTEQPFEPRPARIRPNAGAWNPLVDMIDVFPGHRGESRDGTLGLFDAPVGIRFEIEEATKSEILLEAQTEWEEDSIAPLYVWEEDGRYYMLYDVAGGQCLAASDDAMHWTRPELNLVEFNGSTRNNILPHPCKGTTGIFEDPSAPPQERFKAMGGRMFWADPDSGDEIDGEEAARRLKAEQDDLDYTGPRAEIHGVMSAWTSPDRRDWTPIERPLARRPVNGGISAGWDPHHQRYFCYIQLMGYTAPDGIIDGVGKSRHEDGMQIRTIGFSHTTDFNNWPPPRLIVHPDSEDPPDISWYGACYFPYPGRDDLHGMMIPVFHQIADTIDGQIAFSRDGLFWTRPERRANLPLGKVGEGDECIAHYWRSGIFELPGGSWACPYTGNSVLHDAIRTTRDEDFPHRRRHQIRWAMWRPHRFCGLRAEGEGRMTMQTIFRVHDELRLNYRCDPGGWIEIELLDKIPRLALPDADPVPGFSFADCDRIMGDSEDHLVTWKGKSDIAAVGESVGIRVRMFDAKLFAYRV